jgi:cation diffusion facilitator family transporter
MSESVLIDRSVVVRRGRRLEYLTIAWNLLEAAVGVAAGLAAGSIALLGFGIDSFVEVVSGAALLWRISADANQRDRERKEKRALRIVGICFVALAAYISYESVGDLWRKRAPEHSVPGIILAIASLLVMPLLSRAKSRVGHALGSAAMRADAKQSAFCAYLSAIVIVGLLLNAFLGWWWADPLAALVMVPIIAREGIEALRGKVCDDCASLTGSECAARADLPPTSTRPRA